MHDKYKGGLHSWNSPRPSAPRKIPSCQLLLSTVKSTTSPTLSVFPLISPLAHLISIAGSLGRALISFSFGVGPHIAYKMSANHENDSKQNPLAGNSVGKEYCSGVMHIWKLAELEAICQRFCINSGDCWDLSSLQYFCWELLGRPYLENSVSLLKKKRRVVGHKTHHLSQASHF